MPRQLVLAGVLLAVAVCPALAQTPGQYGPAVDTKGWLNADKGFEWDALQGRVVLIERWATT